MKVVYTPVAPELTLEEIINPIYMTRAQWE